MLNSGLCEKYSESCILYENKKNYGEFGKLKYKRSIGTLMLVLLFCIISLGNVGCGHKRGTIYQAPSNNPDLQNTLWLFRKD